MLTPNKPLGMLTRQQTESKIIEHFVADMNLLGNEFRILKIKVRTKPNQNYREYFYLQNVYQKPTHIANVRPIPRYQF